MNCRKLKNFAVRIFITTDESIQVRRENVGGVEQKSLKSNEKAVNQSKFLMVYCR